MLKYNASTNTSALFQRGECVLDKRFGSKASVAGLGRFERIEVVRRGVGRELIGGRR